MAPEIQQGVKFAHHISIDEVLVNRKRIVFESRLLLFLPLLPQISERIGA
jgi:hypothetical protein